MSDHFLLIDLVSQATAVESLLHGKSVEDKLKWLSTHGLITAMPKTMPAQRQVFRFESQVGNKCGFFLDEEKFVFIGDHTTFTQNKEL